MKIAAVQMSLADDLQVNFENMMYFIDKAIKAKVDVICFPEMSLTSYSPSVLSDNYLKVKIEKYIETFKSISQKISNQFDIRRRNDVKPFDFDECLALTGDVNSLYNLYITKCFGNS